MRTASWIAMIGCGLASAHAQVTKTRIYDFERAVPRIPLVAPRGQPMLGQPGPPGIAANGATLLAGGPTDRDPAALAARAKRARAIAHRRFRLALRRHEQRCDSAPCSNPAPLPDYREAVGLMRTLVQRFPKWSGSARALLNLGDVLHRRGPAHDLKGALGAYGRLVRSYPGSRAAAKALLALAEHHFAQASMHRARSLYERILRRGVGDLGPYAAYKLGWVHYNLGNLASAERRFLEVIRIGSGALRAQAARDLLLPLVRRRDWRKAPGLLAKELGRSQALRLLPRLAALYENRGDLRSAKGLYEHLIAAEPSALKQRDYYQRLDRIERRLGGP